jgi:hypothetical protein
MKMNTWVGILLALIAYGTVGYANAFAEKNEILQYPIDNPPLYDRLHNIIPVIPRKYADWLAIGLVAYFIIRWGFKYPKVIENYLWIVTFLFIGRVLCFTVTQFPPCHPDCSSRREGDKIIANPFKKGWVSCKDNMYSGHTLHVVLVLLFILYLSKSVAEKSIIFVLVFIELILIIGARLHYSCDVFVATLVSILVFFAWPSVDNVMKNITDGGIYGLMLKQTHNLKE